MVITKNKDAVVRTLSRADMLKERDELLKASGLSEAELRTLGATWDLDADRRGILVRIDSLDFLLANSPPA